MTNLNSLLQKNAFDLLAISEDQILKSAGIVQKVKNFFSKLVNPEYRKQVLDLESETITAQEIIEKLDQALENLRESISSGNLEEYKLRAREVQELSLLLLKELKVVNQETKEVKEILRRTYTKEDMTQEDFLPRFKSSLPKEYDLELNTLLRRPLKSFEWYKNLSINDISVNSSLILLLKKIAEVFRRPNYAYEEEQIKSLLSEDKFQELLFNFTEAIINGEIIQVKPKVPSKNVPNAQFGQTFISITTTPFLIPKTNILVSCEVGLIDLKSSIVSRNKLSIQYIGNVTVHGNPKNSVYHGLQQLKKEAQQTQTKMTTLSELELAKVLQSGYEKVFGSSPSVEVLGFGWAQAILEAGRPIKLRGNNIGNIKASEDWVKLGKPYTVMDTEELDKSGKAYVHSGAKWKAFNSPVEGAIEYWSFLQRKHPSALRWAASDLSSAVVSLAAGSYFTANIKKYSAGVQKLYQEFVSKLAPQLNISSSPLPAPGPKPEMKDFGGQYSKEEKEKIRSLQNRNTEIQESNNSDESSLDQIDSLLTSLYASSGPITQIVKNSLLQTLLPTTKITARFLSEQETNKNEKIKFAIGMEKLLKDFLGAETKIDKDNLLLFANISGSRYSVLEATQALSNSLSDSLEILHPQKSKIYSVVVAEEK